MPVVTNSGLESSSNVVLTHCLMEPHSMEQWAPASVMHVARAIGSCQLRLDGPSLLFQRMRSQTVVVNHRRYMKQPHPSDVTNVSKCVLV
jgi:hypothetical protein